MQIVIELSDETYDKIINPNNWYDPNSAIKDIVKAIENGTPLPTTQRMTKEEAIKLLKYNSNVIHKTINGETDSNEVEALDMAIKALEQEPTTKNDLGVDCISKAKALDCVNWGYNLSDVYKKINELPSVTPIRPKGHWIEVLGGCKCSCCDMAFSRLKETCADNYCPNCGADMREVEE